jgi:hypothetical protein
MDNNQDQGQEQVNMQVPVGVQDTVAPSTGVVGLNGPFPAELNRWNWGAFLLNWIWALGNQVWIGLLVLLAFIPVIGGIISLVVTIMLGIKGNEWAWNAKKWDSVEHFKAVQKKWAKWGVILLIISFVLAVVSGIAIVLILLNVSKNNSVSYPLSTLPYYQTGN